MKQNSTLLVFLLDKSGSMEEVKDDTIGGFNSFIERQLKETHGEVKSTLFLFDTNCTTVHAMVPLAEVPKLTKETYRTGGWTALVDSMCQAIDITGAKLASMSESERPSRVIFVTLTDGKENRSTMYTSSQLRDRITHQESKYAWNFVYLGANQDSFAEAHKYGIQMQSITNWDYANTKYAYANLSTSISSAVNNCTSVDMSGTNNKDYKVDVVVPPSNTTTNQ